jgi:hypothetical protein
MVRRQPWVSFSSRMMRGSKSSKGLPDEKDLNKDKGDATIASIAPVNSDVTIALSAPVNSERRTPRKGPMKLFQSFRSRNSGPSKIAARKALDLDTPCTTEGHQALPSTKGDLQVEVYRDPNDNLLQREASFRAKQHGEDIKFDVLTPLPSVAKNCPTQSLGGQQRNVNARTQNDKSCRTLSNPGPIKEQQPLRRSDASSSSSNVPNRDISVVPVQLVRPRDGAFKRMERRMSMESAASLRAKNVSIADNSFLQPRQISGGTSTCSGTDNNVLLKSPVRRTQLLKSQSSPAMSPRKNLTDFIAEYEGIVNPFSCSFTEDSSNSTLEVSPIESTREIPYSPETTPVGAKVKPVSNQEKPVTVPKPERKGNLQPEKRFL